MNVILDTNAYRRLAQGLSNLQIGERAEQLRRAELTTNIHALASPVVMLELLAHTADMSDPHCIPCIRAIALLVRHCEDRHEKCCLRMVATCEMEILGMLFHTVPSGFEESIDTVRLMCQQLLDVYLLTGSAEKAREACGLPNLESVASEVRRREDEYMAFWKSAMSRLGLSSDTTGDSIADDRYRDSLRRVLNSGVAAQMFALLWVLRAEKQAGVVLSDVQAQNHAKKIAEHFAVPFTIHQNLCLSSLSPGFKIGSRKKRRENTVWDMDIAAIVGASHTINDCPVVLVTNDKGIVTACKAAGCSQNVMRVPEYLAKIGLHLPGV